MSSVLTSKHYMMTDKVADVKAKLKKGLDRAGA